MFKFGDKVRCTKTSKAKTNHHGVVGETYIVNNSYRCSHSGIRLLDLVGLDKGSISHRFELVKEPFDVLKALREGKKVSSASVCDKDRPYYSLGVINSLDVLDGGHEEILNDLILNEDWEEYVEPRKLGLYWTTREGCDYDDVSEWDGTKWVIPNTDMPVTVVEVGNQIERPKYET